MNLKGDARIQKDNAGNLPRAHRMPSKCDINIDVPWALFRANKTTQIKEQENKQGIFYYMCILKTKTNKQKKPTKMEPTSRKNKNLQRL